MTDAPTGYVPPENAPAIDLRAPVPRVKRLNRAAVAAVVAGLGVLIAFALVAALRRPEKPPTPAKSSTQLVLPADALNDLPADYATAAAPAIFGIPVLLLLPYALRRYRQELARRAASQLA